MIIYQSEKFKIERDETGERWTIYPGTSWMEANSIWYELSNKTKEDEWIDELARK
jgi:hypothetical protein